MKASVFNIDTQIMKVFLIALVVASVGTMPFTANAKWTRTHASDCTTLGGMPIDTSWAIHNNSTTQDMVFLCAINDDDRFLKQNVNILNIHGWDGHSQRSVSAMACRSLWHTTGGGCSSMTQSATGRQHYTLKPALNQWVNTTTGDFGYVWIRIPRKMTGGISSLRGYYTAGV